MHLGNDLYKTYGPDTILVPKCPKGHSLWFSKGIKLKTLFKNYGITIKMEQFPASMHRLLAKEGIGVGKHTMFINLTPDQMALLTKKSKKTCRVCDAIADKSANEKPHHGFFVNMISVSSSNQTIWTTLQSCIFFRRVWNCHNRICRPILTAHRT